jgi:hypothetical protein
MVSLNDVPEPSRLGPGCLSRVNRDQVEPTASPAVSACR